MAIESQITMKTVVVTTVIIEGIVSIIKKNRVLLDLTTLVVYMIVVML